MTFSKTLILTDANEDPIDLTDWVFFFRGKISIDDVDYVFDLTNNAGITVTAIEGKIEFAVPYSDTQDLDDVDAIEVSLTRILDGEKDALIVGQIPVLNDVVA